MWRWAAPASRAVRSLPGWAAGQVAQQPAPRRLASSYVPHLGGSISWFPGHMAKAIDSMKLKIAECDGVVEVRDARVPLSSTTPVVREVIGDRQHVVVFNKADLAAPRMQAVRSLRKLLWGRSTLAQRMRAPLAGDPGAAVQRRAGNDVCQLSLPEISAKGAVSIRSPARLAAVHAQPADSQFVEHLVEVAGAGHRPAGSVFLVLGVPNAGKSSLIKAVAQAGQGSKRRGKRRRGPVTGRKAGVTRFTSAFPVSTDPAVFLMDSPGILVPRIQDTAQGVKLALCGALPDASVPADELAHFLLCHARDTRSKAFRAALALPHLHPDSWEVLRQLAGQWGLVDGGGVPDTDAAAQRLVSMFRLGRLGPMTLDDLSS